jgi:polyhydroxyalkanoate synthesis regulator phasin
VALETKTVVAQIDSVLNRAGIAPGTSATRASFRELGDAQLTRLSTSWLSAIERLSPPGSAYPEQARDEVANRGVASATTLTILAGMLQALRDDYEAGFVVSLAELVHADVFGDFLEMAAELLEKNYKDGAAVITGSVLEEHLRKLAARQGVATTTSGGGVKKASSLNDELVKTGAYNKIEQKSVTAWLGLRNNAAHGSYGEYSKEQVALMMEGVRTFLIAHPA